MAPIKIASTVFVLFSLGLVACQDDGVVADEGPKQVSLGDLFGALGGLMKAVAPEEDHEELQGQLDEMTGLLDGIDISAPISSQETESQEQPDQMTGTYDEDNNISTRLSSAQETGNCTAPDLPNGEVTSTGNANHNVATFSCQPGFTLVGRKIIKCMAGKWNGEFPMCIAIGICDPQDSPQIANGRKLKKFRGAVYKVKCDRGFKRYGPMYLTCEGSSWNFNNLPLCIKAGCDENEMSHLEYGQAKSMRKGAMYKFKCEEGTTMEGSSMVFCDGTHWNGTAPRCLYLAYHLKAIDRHSGYPLATREQVEENLASVISDMNRVCGRWCIAKIEGARVHGSVYGGMISPLDPTHYEGHEIVAIPNDADL